MRLTGDPLAGVVDYEWARREFREGNRGDQWFSGQCQASVTRGGSMSVDVLRMPRAVAATQTLTVLAHRPGQAVVRHRRKAWRGLRGRQLLPTFQEHLPGERWTPESAQLSDGPAQAGDPDGLTSSDALDDLATMVA